MADPADPIVSIRRLVKRYANGFEALKGVDLDIAEGEILALLGPNGAGKTTLISAICGITTPTEGTITVGGHDTVRDFRAARALIGLVPQEVNLEPFEPVAGTVAFSRGLFGKPRDPDADRPRAGQPVAGRQGHGARARAVGRDEAARADRQGAVARAERPVPRRAHGGRRRRAAPRHVGDRRRPEAAGRHHHPDDPLHRGGRGHRRPRRRHRPGPHPAGGGEGGADGADGAEGAACRPDLGAGRRCPSRWRPTSSRCPRTGAA